MNERNTYTPWRWVLVEMARENYSSEDKTHGLSHAIEVETLALEISQEPEYSHLSINPVVLSAASLLHDAGYSKKKKGWSVDQREHVREGMIIASEILPEIPDFSGNPESISEVLWLIFNHDNTNFLFPMKDRGGRPAINRLLVSEAEKSMGTDPNLAGTLLILKEADSRLGTGEEGAKRTFDFNLEQNLPLFARGDPLRALMWGESVMGSTRLAAKRALLDAKTEKGKEIAWNGYLEVEKFIEAECFRNGVPYDMDLGYKEFDLITNQEIQGDLEIIRVHPWEELEGILRQVRLKGDPTLLPYVTARIESQFLNVEDVHPLSLYALSDQIDLTRKLRELFLARYASDLLYLSGIVEFEIDGENHLISPPLVEKSKIDDGKNLLVDGIHRHLLAREVGFPGVRSIVISETPDHFPLVPLPLEWDDVEIFSSVPKETAKRHFRFSERDSFPDISPFSDVKVNDDNYLYFFYRDLSRLGSSGIRKAGES